VTVNRIGTILKLYFYRTTKSLAKMSKCEQCIVRDFSPLKALNTEELVNLAACKTSRIIKKGEVIFKEGENLHGIFCIKNGVCKLTKLSSNGKDSIVKLVTKGELLGQRSMISEEPINLSAVAIADMQVCFIPKVELMRFFDKNNSFSMNVMKTICGDLKKADEQIVSISQKTVKQRLAETLLYLENTFGKNTDGTLKIQLSRAELSSLVGTAAESCIRLLSDFKKSGLIDLIGKKIIVKDLVKLKKMVD
jgi:CRP-like cAMP-binding protein